MNKYFGLLCFGFLLSSCNSSSGGGGAAAPNTPEQEVLTTSSSEDVLAKVPVNNFQMLKEKLSDAETSERFDLGCETKGILSPLSEEIIDPAIKLGDVFKVYKFIHALKDNKFELIEEITNFQKTLDQVGYNLNYEKLESPKFSTNDVNQIFTEKPNGKLVGKLQHDKQKSSKNSLEYADLKFSPSFLEEIKAKANQKSIRIDCGQKGSTTAQILKDQVDLVQYELNEKQVRAYIFQKIYKLSSIECKYYTKLNDNSDEKLEATVDVGPGIAEYKDVTSNEVVSPFKLQCGGTNLYTAYKLTLDSGKILENAVEKILIAPVR